MAEICFTLTKGRTEEDLFEDTAILNGYTDTVSEVKHVTVGNLTKAEMESYVYPDDTVEGSKKVESFTEDGTTTFTISYDRNVVSLNPETAIEFGEKIVLSSFARQDAETNGQAVKLRAQLEYDAMSK